MSLSSDRQYMVLVPEQVYAGIPEMACVHLNNLNETVTLSITLDYRRHRGSLLPDRVVDKADFHCVPFVASPAFISDTNLPPLQVDPAIITVEVRGSTQHFLKKKSIHVMKVENAVFVQTDKPIYKPGQTVRFRIVSVDVNFHPVNETFPVVYIENSRKNRISQWQNVRLPGGLTQLSFPLSDDPVLGTYKVTVTKESGKKTEHAFEVKKYVLPKFEVQVKMPKIIGLQDEEFEVSACGLYTYGKPVPGLVTINVCRRLEKDYCTYGKPYTQRICKEFSSQQADNKGCVTQRVNTMAFQLRRKGHEMKIQVEATVREEGTGVELTGYGSCQITNILSKLKFTKVDSHYRRGLPFYGQVLLVDEKDEPIPNRHVAVSVNEVAYGSNFATDEHGLLDLSIDTTNLTAASLTITVTHKQNTNRDEDCCFHEIHTQAQHTVNQLCSPSNSYVHLELVTGTLTCGETQEIRAHYILNEQILKGEKELTFFYLIKARGSLARTGTHLLPVATGNTSKCSRRKPPQAPSGQAQDSPSNPQPLTPRSAAKGVFSLSLHVEADMAPAAQLLLYATLPDGEIIADAQKLDVENCFANKVNLTFSAAQGPPGSDVHLQVKATPGSLCGVRAVDQSVLLMKPEAELSAQSVYNLIPTKTHQSRLPHMYLDKHDLCIFLKETDPKRITDMPEPRLAGDYVHKIFEEMRLLLHLTESSTSTPKDRPPKQENFHSCPDLIPGEPRPKEVPELVMKETVRKYFPETWIWDLLLLDESGGQELVAEIPDTITEWKASALCLSGSTGLGLSPTVSLQAFQPFFLELTLPYSVVRGETFTLKATVFSYLSHCIRITVQLEMSPAFLAEPADKNDQSHCVCGSGRKTVSWAVIPKWLGNVNFTATAEALRSQEPCGDEVPGVPTLGHRDTVIRPLIVEPEGIEKEESSASLFCASDTEESEEFSLKVPSDVVEGSARATYSVFGDIMGSAIHNLQNLLQMPYGCGEQNMVLFVPNIHVLNYLKETRQLTETSKSKALSYLVSGYQRQLKYKNSDGSYSTFGDQFNSPGNTWLTAFVLKSFVQAQAYIFVDNLHITDALTWLTQKQKKNGCFRNSGSLFNNNIKGGVDDEVTLSAYVTIALLEMPRPVSTSVVHKALSCLETELGSISNSQEKNTYAKALFAYAFSLAGNQTERKKLLESLDREAVKGEDSIHWERPGRAQADKTLNYQPRAPSAEVEMSSYVLLARLTAQPAPSAEDLSVARRIVNWLTRQQNPSGGFSSTQDTVVALQALAKYEAATFTTDEKVSVLNIKSSKTFAKEFHVNDTNRLVLQEVDLPEVPGDYRTTVSGSGCVYHQVSLRYNVLPKKEGKVPFALQVDALPQDDPGMDTPRNFQIHVNISYTGERPSSNMAIADVKMVSGFVPVKTTVRKLEEKPEIRRTEVSNNHVLIYFDELTNQVMSFSFSVEQDIQVENLKPAAVKVYDYYETDEFAIEEYRAPCSAGRDDTGTIAQQRSVFADGRFLGPGVNPLVEKAQPTAVDTESQYVLETAVYMGPHTMREDSSPQGAMKLKKHCGHNKTWMVAKKSGSQGDCLKVGLLSVWDTSEDRPSLLFFASKKGRQTRGQNPGTHSGREDRCTWLTGSTGSIPSGHSWAAAVGEAHGRDRPESCSPVAGRSQIRYEYTTSSNPMSNLPPSTIGSACVTFQPALVSLPQVASSSQSFQCQQQLSYQKTHPESSPNDSLGGLSITHKSYSDLKPTPFICFEVRGRVTCPKE
ncbi:pregnancy zone protein-like [Ctenodactylus gundi]